MKQIGNLWRVAGALVLALVIVGHLTAQTGSRKFDETGQVLDSQYGFLQFWEQHNGAVLYGPPITGIVLEANVPVQYFARGRLEYRSGASVPGALGRERTRWRRFAAMAHPAQADALVFKETGHTISGAFLHFWRDNDGALLFGAPLSEPLWESIGGSSVRVQYFERARLEEQSVSDGQGVAVSPLGREIALAKGLVLPDQQPAVSVVQAGPAGGVQDAFAELAPPTPTPVPPTATPLPTATAIPPTPTDEPTVAGKPVPPNNAAGTSPLPTRTRPRPTATPPAEPTTVRKPASAGLAGKVVDVNLSTQRLVAMENGVVVRRTGVSSGRDGFNTPTGTFNIYAKLKLQTMRGSLNGISWVVPNVPNVMYINGSVALHGTYWHNLFGTGARLSHGCINLSLMDAAWMYGWAPMGTTVVVHY